MSYAAAAVQGLEACPFCKDMFPTGEQSDCPTCGVKLVPAMAEAPPAGASVDASHDDEEDDGEPQLPWLHWGHARGPVLVACVLGLVAFALPWVSAFTPERAVYHGYEIAKRTGMGWAAGVAWFTLLPVVLSRRTLPMLRGARLAAALLALVPGAVAALLLSHPPGSVEVRGVLMRVRFDWSVGIYLTLALSLITAPLALFRLGKE